MKNIIRRNGTATRQAGMAAIGLATLMLLACAILLGGSIISRSSLWGGGTFESQLRALTWAKQALLAFVAVNGYLPCPASHRGGAGDCSSGHAQGYLPVESLQDSAPPSSDMGVLDVRYLLYRGGGTDPSDPDLGKLSEGFSPSDVTGTVAVEADYSPVTSSLDVCGKLGALSSGESTPPRSDRAHIRDTTGNLLMNVAFGLTAPQNTAGLSTDSVGPAIEIPSRVHDANYRDLVWAQSATSLQTQLGCPTTMKSLDALYVAQSFSVDADGARTGNIEAAGQFEQFTYLFIEADSLDVISAGFDAANLAQKQIEIAADLAKLIPGLPETLPLVVTQEEALVAANAGWKPWAISLAKATAALVVDTIYLESYKTVAEYAKNSTFIWSGLDTVKAADAAGIGIIKPTP